MAVEIAGVQAIQSLTQNLKTQQTENIENPFSQMLKDAIQNVTETDATVKQDAIRLATGQADDLHTITINAAKADLAIQTLVQVRNKALDAYNEIMRISL